MVDQVEKLHWGLVVKTSFFLICYLFGCWLLLFLVGQIQLFILLTLPASVALIIDDFVVAASHGSLASPWAWIWWIVLPPANVAIWYMIKSFRSSQNVWPRLTIPEWIFGILLLFLWFTHRYFLPPAPILINGKYWDWVWFVLLAWVLISAFLLYSKGQHPGIDESTQKSISLNGPFLSITEKILIWIGGLTIPYLVGPILCLAWYKKNYLKAREANLILMAGFFISNTIIFILAQSGVFGTIIS